MRLLAAGDRAADQRLLPRAAAQGRGRDAARGDRRAVLGRAWRSWPAIVALNVVLGGMRGVTYVQAFQYWVKVFAIALPGDPAADPPRRAAGARRAVRLRAAAHRAERHGRRARPAADADVPGHRRDAHGPGGRAAAAARHRGPGRGGHRRADRRRVVAPGERVRPRLAAADLLAAAGDVPRARWACRTSSSASTPTRTARRRAGRPCACSACSAPSTCSPPSTACSAARSRPSSTSPATPTRSCCACPPRRGRALPGDILAAIVAAGAFAAFMSTASGLLVSIAGTVSHDVWPGQRRRGARALPGRRRRSGWSRPRCSRWPRARSTSPCSSAGRSRWPRARSARCCCSASGGRA